MWNAQASMPPPGGYAMVACAPQHDELHRLRESNAQLLRVGAMREDQLKKYESFEATNVAVRNKLSETVLEKTRALEEAARIMTGMREELLTQQRTANQVKGALELLQRTHAEVAAELASLRGAAVNVPQLESAKAKALLLVEATANDVANMKKELASERAALALAREQASTDRVALQKLAADRSTLLATGEQLAADRATILAAGEQLAADRATLSVGAEQLAADRATLLAAEQQLAADRATLSAGTEQQAANRTMIIAAVEQLATDRAALSAGLEQLAIDRAALSAGLEQLATDRAALSTGSEQLATDRAALSTGLEQIAPDRAAPATAEPAVNRRKEASTFPASDRPQRRAKTAALLKMAK